MTFIYPTKKVDEIEAEILESATPSAAYLLRWLIGAVRERDAEIESLRSGYLTDEHGNEYVQVCILKEKIREQEAEIERLRDALGEREREGK